MLEKQDRKQKNKENEKKCRTNFIEKIKIIRKCILTLPPYPFIDFTGVVMYGNDILKVSPFPIKLTFLG